MEPLEVYRYRPDALRALYDPILRERLPWYYDVLEGKRPAKFLIAKGIEAPKERYEDLSLEELWKIHDKLAAEHRKVWLEVREGAEAPKEARPSYLHVKIAIARRMMSSCELCEWRCRADRRKRVGICRVADKPMVYSAFLHIGEEAPLVPSGTIFYGGCPLRCAFCQNWEISQVKSSEYVSPSPQGLALLQESLILKGARNINHVGGEPTPHIPFILESMEHLSVSIPQLWNSNMYMTPEAMKLIRDVIDIWLPDFKFGGDGCALRLSKVKNYFAAVTRNHLEAYDGGLGDMIIRHLVMPNHIECCTRPVLEWLSKNLPRAVLNLMDQYRPDHVVVTEPERYRDIARRLSRHEFERAKAIARELGYRMIVEDLMIIP